MVLVYSARGVTGVAGKVAVDGVERHIVCRCVLMMVMVVFVVVVLSLTSFVLLVVVLL